MRDVLDEYDGQIVSGDKCGLNFLTFLLQLTENSGKNLNQETNKTRNPIRARSMMVSGQGDSLEMRIQGSSYCQLEGRKVGPKLRLTLPPGKSRLLILERG